MNNKSIQTAFILILLILTVSSRKTIKVAYQFDQPVNMQYNQEQNELAFETTANLSIQSYESDSSVYSSLPNLHNEQSSETVTLQAKLVSKENEQTPNEDEINQLFQAEKVKLKLNIPGYDAPLIFNFHKGNNQEQADSQAFVEETGDSIYKTSETIDTSLQLISLLKSLKIGQVSLEDEGQELVIELYPGEALLL